MVKDFLSQRGVRFTLKNLQIDAEAREEFRRLGYLLPPVTIIGREVITGFDPTRLDQILEQYPQLLSDAEDGGTTVTKRSDQT